MKLFWCILAIIGALLIHHQLVSAQDTRLTREYVSKILSEAKEKYNIPAIAVTVMSSETQLIQEIQG